MALPAATGTSSVQPSKARSSSGCALMDCMSPTQRHHHNEEAARTRDWGQNANFTFFGNHTRANSNPGEAHFDTSDKENDENRRLININGSSSLSSVEKCRHSEYREKKRKRRMKREVMNRITLQQEQIEEERRSMILRKDQNEREYSSPIIAKEKDREGISLT